MRWVCSGYGSGRPGRAPGEGAYIRFPLRDMLRLTALESQRHRAVVLGEDLGTVPEGFQEALIETGVLGIAGAVVRARRKRLPFAAHLVAASRPP